jgi:hypothetical protein
MLPPGRAAAQQYKHGALHNGQPPAAKEDTYV